MQNDRKKSFIKLFLFFIFFALLFFISTINKKSINNTGKKTTETIFQKEELNDNLEEEYENIKKELLKYKYEFEFTINNNESYIKYSGKRFQEEIEGFKEDNGNIQKFYINEEKIYSISGENKEYIGDLNNIQTDITYLDIDNIFAITDVLRYYIDDDNIVFENNGIQISISKIVKNKCKIIIKNGDYILNLKYYNINNIDEL